MKYNIIDFELIDDSHNIYNHVNERYILATIKDENLIYKVRFDISNMTYLPFNREHYTPINISKDLKRETISELGHRAPYSHCKCFPMEQPPLPPQNLTQDPTYCE